MRAESGIALRPKCLEWCESIKKTAPDQYGQRRLLSERWLAGVDEDANYLFQIPAATPKNPPQQRKRDRDRAERMRLAGGPMPSLREKAYAFARQRTIVRTSDFTAIGIPRHYLAWMCEEGWLVREGYGLYRAAEREAA